MVRMRNGVQRYTDVAVAFHWITAILAFIQLAIGFIFAGMARGPVRAEWFLWHKTLGILILLLSLARLSWRIANPPPPLPAALPRWEAMLARLSHWLFYGLLIGLPLSGWLFVSTGKATQAPPAIPLVGGIQWPVIPGLPHAAHESFERGHIILVVTLIALLILHVAAALKHQFVDRTRLANRMPPFAVEEIR
jgi:cytochrome b561